MHVLQIVVSANPFEYIVRANVDLLQAEVGATPSTFMDCQHPLSHRVICSEIVPSIDRTAGLKYLCILHGSFSRTSHILCLRYRYLFT